MRDYYNEALRIVWAGGNWDAALELLNQAQAELARVRAEFAAATQRAETAEAALAAVPVMCIASMVVGEATESTIEYVRLWLTQPPEVQP